MLIKNGTVVTEDGVIQADLRTSGEVIAEIAPGLASLPGEDVVDARGKLVLPGGVDVHTHMDLDLGDVRATDDFYTGTVAAACGGTTSIVDHMAFGPRGFSITSQVEAYHKLAGGKAVIDYGFHGVMDHVDDAILEELEQLVSQGITSHKFYLTYGGKISDYEVVMLMEQAAKLGVMLTVHPENDGGVAYLRDKCRRDGNTAPIFHARSRPQECEAEAVSRAAFLARMTGAPLYIVHLSGGMGLDVIRRARKDGQQKLFAETCPQYLFLDESAYLREDGLKYIMAPPLRPKINNELLWQGIEAGDIDTIATDHCPFFYEKEKMRGKDDFTLAPGGAPGVEARLALIYTFGVQSGEMSLQRFVDLCCTRPAKLFGLYPQKGALQVESDADIVIWDPDKPVILSHNLLHENTDYTPYEGMRLTGWPVMTISRGEVVVAGGEVKAEAGGRGKFIKRRLPVLD